MTGEHRATTSRITDALLPAPEVLRPAPEAADLPAAETTTRLRPLSPAAPSLPAGPSPAPARPAAASARPPAPARPAAAPVRSSAPPARPAPPPARPAPVPPAPPATAPSATAPPVAPSRPSVPPARPAAPPATAPSATAPPVALSRPPVPPARPAAAPPRPPAVPVDGPVAPGRPAPHVGAAASPRPPGLPPYAHSRGPGALPPEVPVEVAPRARPRPERRRGRSLAVAACAVLGFGLVGGALAGVWLAAAEPGRPVEPVGYTEAKDLWHNAPVDTLFPRTLAGPGAGPGGADRTWTRIVVAPDAPCTSAALAEGLLATVEPLGCERVLRATYTDATASSVITVGLVFTRAEATTQRTLGKDLTARLGADVPPALAGPGTVAARFGAPQRAAWWLNAPADLPVVVTAVSGFADGRKTDGAPVSADEAVVGKRPDPVAQSGLGHETKGITERLVRLLRTAATTAAEENDR
ncbi:hypothetical protein ACIQUL_22725 [Streptomyces sp. NPDC090303]|uniref:hypothetical protein n=1 Tax=Streptomyces sp. NPDC090303 TaxID=3365960 RepID=UPI0038244183